MNKETVIRLAREAGFTNPERFESNDEQLQGLLKDFWTNLDRFASYVIVDTLARLEAKIGCPSCEANKVRASIWRREVYKLGGTPLPD